MATLEADTQGRYSSQEIIALTNPDNATATTVDATRLSYAATDVKGEFLMRGIIYDSTDTRHVNVAVDGVVAKLIERGGKAGAPLAERVSRWTERLDLLSKTTSRDKVAWSTTSIRSPSSEQKGTETVRPLFDNDRFRRFDPDPPPTDELD